MMNLIETIEQDLIQALKAGDDLKVSVLRLIKTGLTNLTKQPGKEKLTDDDAIDVIKKEIKQRQDSIAQLGLNRPDLKAKDEQAIDLLKKYSPQEMPWQELAKLIDQAITQTSATTQADIGKVMAAVMPQVKGRADGKTVSDLVLQKLSS